MVNRALNGAYPPGSTFKPFMALAAAPNLASARRSRPSPTLVPTLLAGIPSGTTRRAGTGSSICTSRSSSRADTYYYMLANDMGIDNIARFMGWIGLGSKTGVDLEGESEGVLPAVAGVEEEAFQTA